MNYYEEIWQEVLALKDEQPLVAYMKLQEELTLPYVPQEYQKKFEELYQELKSRIATKAPNTNLSKDQILKIVSMPKHPLGSLALQQMQHLDLRANVRAIQLLFYNSEVSPVIKTIIYEYMVQQKVDHNFILAKKVVNPVIEGPISSNPGFIKTITQIKINTHKNPTLQKIAVECFENVVLKAFPPLLPYSLQNVKIFIVIAAQMLGTETELKLDAEEETQKNLYLEIIKRNH